MHLNCDSCSYPFVLVPRWSKPVNSFPPHTPLSPVSPSPLALSSLVLPPDDFYPAHPLLDVIV